MSKKRRKKSGIGTHYSYLGGGEHMRVVKKIFNLSTLKSEARRKLIGNLIDRHGECLAILPADFKVDCDLDELESFLEGNL
jgi:hypothetical protein